MTASLQVQATDTVVLRVRDRAGRAVPRAQVFVDRSPYGSIRAVPPTVILPAGTPTGITSTDGVLQIAREDTAFAAATIVANGFSPRMLRLWGSDSMESSEESDGTESGGASPVIEVVLSPSARIEGRVNGAPDGAAIRALAGGSSLLDESRARLDGWFPYADAAFVAPIAADGTFNLDPLPAAAVLRLDLLVGDQVLSCLPECMALLPGEVRRVDWMIGAGVALECLVRDERGAPVRAARVQFLAPNYGGWVSPYEPWSAVRIRTTDATGRVLFDDVHPGRWTVVLERSRSMPQRRVVQSWPEADVTVDVADSDTTIELTAFDVRTISGVVVAPGGAPIEGAIHVTRMIDGRPAHVTSMHRCADDGTFRSGPLAPGTYRIVAHRDGKTESPFAPSEPVYVEAGDDSLRVSLRRGRDLDLRAIDEASCEPADAHFSIGCEGGGWGPLCLFQLAPTRLVRCVPPGRLLVIARTGDGRVGAARVEEPLADVAADHERLPVDVPVRAGAKLHVLYRGSVPVVLCEVTVDGILVDEFSVISGGEMRLAFPPGRGTLRWRVDARGPSEAQTAREGLRELTFIAGEETAIAIEL